MRTTWLVAALLTAASPAIAAKPPKVQWLKTFSGMGVASGYSVRQTSDGGFIAVGATAPDSTDAPGYYCIVRSSSDGETLWTRTLSRAAGGSRAAIAYSVLQTPDGGYAVFGNDKGTGYTEQPWLAKLDGKGSVQWQSTLYIDTLEFGSSIQQTADGGFILAGKNQVQSTYVMKVDSVGQRQWCWSIDEDWRSCWPKFVPVAAADSSGYVTTGHNDSFGLTLWKVDDAGTTLWRQVYADERAYDGQSIVLTADRGFAIVGLAGRKNVDEPGRVYLLKVGADGTRQWCRYYGGRRYLACSSVWQTRDCGFVLAGTVVTTITRKKKRDYHSDAFVLRTDQNGNEVWWTTLSPSTEDDGECVQQTSDGGYVVCGGLVRRVGKKDQGCMFVAKLAPERIR